MRTLDAASDSQPDAEAGVLSCLIQAPEQLADEAAALTEEQFSIDAHRRIYASLRATYSEHDTADLVLLTAELQRRGELAAIGGPVKLTELSRLAPSPGMLGHYLGILREAVVLRRVRQICQDYTTRIEQGDEESVECLLAGLEGDAGAIRDILQPRWKQAGVRDPGKLAEAFAHRLQEWEETKGEGHGRRTGLADLDACGIRLYPGQRLVVAGAPNVGKSTLAMQVVLRAAQDMQGEDDCEEKVGIVSLEDSAERFTERAISHLSGISLARMKGGRLSQARNEPQKVMRAAAQFARLPIIVEAHGGLSALELEAVMRRLKREGCSVIVVDYLQLVRGNKTGMDTRQRVEDASAAIQAAAISLNISTIAVAALRKLDGKKPTMDDLKESGNIAYDATEIILLSEDERGEDGEPTLITADIAKQKDGPKRDVTLLLRGEVFTYYNAIRKDQSEEPVRTVSYTS